MSFTSFSSFTATFAHATHARTPSSPIVLVNSQHRNSAAGHTFQVMRKSAWLPASIQSRPSLQAPMLSIFFENASAPADGADGTASIYHILVTLVPSWHPARAQEDVVADKIVMPQLGESIAEGTIVRWLKKPGDDVKKDEDLLIISTDKVEAEIPSPASGVLLSADVGEGK